MPYNMAEVADLRRAQLPTELLREVVQYYARTVAWREPDNPRHSYKPRWSDFEPLTLASKVLRQLALEAWFEVYYAQSPGDLLHVWPEVGVWTRYDCQMLHVCARFTEVLSARSESFTV